MSFLVMPPHINKVCQDWIAIIIVEEYVRDSPLALLGCKGHVVDDKIVTFKVVLAIEYKKILGG